MVLGEADQLSRRHATMPAGILKALRIPSLIHLTTEEGVTWRMSPTWWEVKIPIRADRQGDAGVHSEGSVPEKSLAYEG